MAWIGSSVDRCRVLLAMTVAMACHSKVGPDSAPAESDDTSVDSGLESGTGVDTGPWSEGKVTPIEDIFRASWSGDVESLAGFAVQFAGESPDVELLLSAPTTANFESTGPLNGVVYVVAPSAVGRRDAELDASATVRICDSSLDGFGWAMDAQSDLDGDGSYDLVVGAPYGGYGQSGLAFVVDGPLLGEVCADLDSRSTFVGESFDAVGSTVLVADMDVDGEPDVAIGVPLKGRIEVLAASATSALDRTDATLEWVGESPSGGLGFAFDNVDDFDGDGIDDIVLGAPTERDGAGAIYLFEGPVIAVVASVADADMIVEGGDAEGNFGSLVRGAGDLDGDGGNDFLAGAYLTENWTGALFVLRNGGDPPATSSEIDIWVRGEREYDMMGSSVAVTDANADAIADLAVGAPGNYSFSYSPGKVHVFETPIRGPLDAARDASLVLVGEASGDLFGFRLAGVDAGGTSGAGFAVGAPFSDHASPAGGTAYVVVAPDLE